MNVEALRARIGEASAPGDWLEVTQAMIDEFAALSGDYQWIHVDAERCRRESPYGTTVAHGMLVQSLIPKLIGDGMDWMQQFGAGINLGSDKVRFTAPVRSGSRIRARWRLADVAEGRDGAIRIVRAVTIDVEADNGNNGNSGNKGDNKSACYAELVGLLYP